MFRPIACDKYYQVIFIKRLINSKLTKEKLVFIELFCYTISKVGKNAINYLAKIARENCGFHKNPSRNVRMALVDPKLKVC